MVSPVVTARLMGRARRRSLVPVSYGIRHRRDRMNAAHDGERPQKSALIGMSGSFGRSDEGTGLRLQAEPLGVGLSSWTRWMLVIGALMRQSSVAGSSGS